MVDYDAAVAAVQDPNADPILLAKIAYENPEFGANVAVNPRCYPGLKRWIAEFGDERARETLAQYGFTAEAFGGPVQDQEAPSQAAQQPAEQQPADAYAADQYARSSARCQPVRSPAARGSGGIRGACGHQSLRFHRRTGPDHHRPDANRPDCPVRA